MSIMNTYNFLALLLLCANASSGSGKLTMWNSNHDIITGSMCAYASLGLSSPAITNSHYFQNNRFLCASNMIGDLQFSCGNCYKITYTSGGTEADARPGSAVVQIVDEMADKTRKFDCLLNPFKEITGVETGVIPITYEQVPCELTDNGSARLTVLDGNNAWNTKVIVSNAQTSVTSVQMTVVGKRGNVQGTFGPMSFQRSGNSATWIDGVAMNGETGVASFSVGLSNGQTLSFDNCFNDWPVPVGSYCNIPVAGGAPQTTRSPTASPTRSPTAAPTARLLTLAPTLAPTAASGGAAVTTTQEPTPNPTAAPTQQAAAAAGGRCFNPDCGCPGNFLAGWCRETHVFGSWCGANENQCSQCQGTWCPQ